MSKIKYAVNELDTSLFEGKTLGDALDQARSILNAPDDAQVKLNGEVTTDMNYTLTSSDSVELIKAAGNKGAQSTSLSQEWWVIG